MNQMPYIPLYVKDFRMDTDALPADACGAWIRILCHLHTRDDRGQDTLPIDGWARIMGVPETDAERILRILEFYNICTLKWDIKGVRIVNRRMVAEHGESVKKDNLKEAKALAEQERRARKKSGGVVAKLLKVKNRKSLETQELGKTPSARAGYGNGNGNETKDKGNERAKQAEKLAKLYKEKVKPSDTTRSRGKDNLRTYMKEGLSFADLKQTILNYGEFCEINQTEERYRIGVGNLFSRRTPEFEQFWPGVYERPKPPRTRGQGPDPMDDIPTAEELRAHEAELDAERSGSDRPAS